MVSSRSRVILPVILGGDFGVYGIGRSFNEAFGCRCLCVSNEPTVSITGSNFFDVHHIEADASDDVLLHELRAIAKENADKALILMANHDLHSTFIARNYDQLAEYYALPFPSLETIEVLTDKVAFAQACEDAGIDAPRGIGVDMSDYSDQWVAPSIPFDFPIVAKAARADAYDRLHFEGKRKIWFLEDEAELAQMWRMLGEAGFRDLFLVQELIPGDNTAMRSITAYVDSHGKVTLIGSARVLLEDHAPTMIGNPVAMITEEFPELWQKAERLLTRAGYRGFANFDVKIDPRDNRAVFFEVNPRIGRNNWYMTAGGANPMLVMVGDLIDGQRMEQKRISREILYSMVPDRLLLRYLRDEPLKKRVKSLIKNHRRFDPLINPHEDNAKRNMIVRLQRLNHLRKFARYYPRPTDRSF